MELSEILDWKAHDFNELRSVAFYYMKQGVYDIPLSIYNAMATVAAPSSYDLQTLGALHLQMGNGLKAIDYLDRALKLNATHYPSLLNRAKALFLLGYKKQALAQAQELVHCPDLLVAQQATAIALAYQ